MLSVRALSTSRECRLALLSSSLVSVKVSGRGDAVQTVVIWWGVDLGVLEVLTTPQPWATLGPLYLTYNV